MVASRSFARALHPPSPRQNAHAAPRPRQRKINRLFWHYRTEIRSLIGTMDPWGRCYATYKCDLLHNMGSFWLPPAASAFVDALSCVHPLSIAKNPPIFFSRDAGKGNANNGSEADSQKRRREEGPCLARTREPLPTYRLPRGRATSRSSASCASLRLFALPSVVRR